MRRVWDIAVGRWRHRPPRQGQINFLARADNLHTIEDFLTDWAPDLRPELTIFTYEHLPPPNRLPPGLWIFADTDRLTDACRPAAIGAWHALSKIYGQHVRLLNKPGRSLPRRALLERLNAAGRNRFEVHIAAEWQSVKRFPVFVRSSTAHTGRLTPLLQSSAILGDYLGALALQGHDASDLLIVEYLDTGRDGLFRKYAAIRAGDTILAQHVFHSRDWHVKASTLAASAAMAAEEAAYVAANPHLPQLREVFDLAGIEFGRIDYAMLEGDVQVWEINTNPTILARRAYYQPEHLPAKCAFASTLTKLLRDMAQATA